MYLDINSTIIGMYGAATEIKNFFFQIRFANRSTVNYHYSGNNYCELNKIKVC